MKKPKQVKPAPEVAEALSSTETAPVDPLTKVVEAAPGAGVKVTLSSDAEGKRIATPQTEVVEGVKKVVGTSGRTYDSVEDMMKGEGFSQEIQSKVAELARNDPPEVPPADAQLLEDARVLMAATADVAALPAGAVIDESSGAPGHLCAAGGCTTMLSEGAPEFCPEHQQQLNDVQTILDSTLNAPPQPSPPTPTKRHFKKLMAAMPLMIAGSRVPFQMLGGNIGVIATTDAALIEGLDALIAAKKSGVVAIDEATYESLKKNLPFVPSPRPPSSKLSIVNPLLPKQKSLHRGQSPKPAGARAAAADLSVGVRVGSDGGGEAGGAGVPPASSHPNKGNGPIDFKPTTAPKQFKMPVTKKATGNSLSGGTVEGKPIRLPD